MDPMSVAPASNLANMVILQEKLVPFITELNIHLALRSEKMTKKKKKKSRGRSSSFRHG